MEIGLPELIIILFIVVLIFGPGRIMKLGRDLGDGVRQFRTGIQTSKDPAAPAPDRDANENANPEESKSKQSG